jgi:hypothetical protein
VSSSEYDVVITICATMVLLLAPFAGITRAVRRLRLKVESSTAPVVAAVVLAVDAIAGLTEFFSQQMALLTVLLSVIWLASALASNGLVRRAKAKAEKAAAAAAAAASEPTAT